MKFLTINALIQYGQKLYDRGDFDGASDVFNHVLTYDAHQPQALQYLKEMGHSLVSIPSPILQLKASQPLVAVKDNIAVEKFDAPALKMVDISDTEALKEAIEAKKHIVEKLRAQIIQMKTNIASQSAT